MFVVLQSALEYWRWVRPNESGLGWRWDPSAGLPISRDLTMCKARLVDPVAPADENVAQALRKTLHTLNVPVHVAVRSQAARARSKLKAPHLVTDGLPDGSFALVGTDVFVSTPEHLFVHMATRLTFAELVWLGFELCSRYAVIHPDAEGVVQARPLTSTSDLAAYLQKAETLRGRDAACKALKYVLDDAASPMEIVVAMLLCLPMRVGGYGLPCPVLNSWMNIGKRERGTVSQGHYAPDLLWKDKLLALEYDGEQGHTGIDRIAHDAERRNDLQHLDVTVMTLTKRQLFNQEAFDRTVRQIAKQIGVKLRTNECRYNWDSRNTALREALLPGGIKL